MSISVPVGVMTLCGAALICCVAAESRASDRTCRDLAKACVELRPQQLGNIFFNHVRSRSNCGDFAITYINPSTREREEFEVMKGQTGMTDWFQTNKGPAVDIEIKKRDCERLRGHVLSQKEEVTSPDKALSDSPSGTNPQVVSPQQTAPDVNAAQQNKEGSELSAHFGGQLKQFPGSSSGNGELTDTARTAREFFETLKDVDASEDLFQRSHDALTRAQQRNFEPPPPPRQGENGMKVDCALTRSCGPNTSDVTGLGETQSLPDPGTSQKLVGTLRKNTVIPGNAAGGGTTDITNSSERQTVKITIPKEALPDGSATPAARDPSGSSSAPFVPHLTASSSPTGKVESALAPDGKSSLTTPAALPAIVVVRKQQVVTTAARPRDQGVNTTFTYAPPQPAYSPPVQRSQSLNVNDAIAVMGVLSNLAVGAAAIAGARGGGGGYTVPSYTVPRATAPTPTITYPRATSPTPPSYNKHCLGSYVCSAQ